jgi:hypothetical protein
MARLHAAFSLAEISLVTGKMQEAPHVKIPYLG